MNTKQQLTATEVKRSNIQHHDIEAEFFESIFPSGSSPYEEQKVKQCLHEILDNIKSCEICIDVGCGTGWLTSFEAPLFSNVIALDISTKMIDRVRKRLGGYMSLFFLLCDAENIPLRNGVADLASISSVLHHLPNPFVSLTDVSRIMKKNGFLFITREPNAYRYRRYFQAFDRIVIKNFTAFMLKLVNSGKKQSEETIPDLDYSKVDIHYPSGLYLKEFIDFLYSYSFDVTDSFSYHWIYPGAGGSLAQRIKSNANFLIEKMPFSSKFGRYITIIARKR